MDYISAIAVDFGSTNSGCARICSFDEHGQLKYDTPHLMHSTGDYAKDNTWFYVEPSFYERIRDSYETLRDEDFRILSPLFVNTANPNIIWGRKCIKANADMLVEKGWLSFKFFKMLLRDGVDDATLSFPLVTIIKVFMRVLKLECLSVESRRLGRPVSADEIKWGVTIPSIWTDENKRVMNEVARDVFSDHARVLSEPEGPLVANLLHSSATGKVQFQDGRTSLVIDLGGGTTDICLMRESQQDDGTFKLEMVANTDGSAAGGNDMDNNFYRYMLRFISKGKTSDAGVAYDGLSDDELVEELFAGFQSQVTDFMNFKESWFELKAQENLAEQSVCDFTFTKAYRKWLANNGHQQVAEVVKEMLVEGCQFPSDSFREQVMKPTFDKICAKVAEIIDNNKAQVRFDNIILAGGMSLNHTLIQYVKRTIREHLGEEGESKVRESPGLFAGSAIMTGACYLLINRGFIRRLALRNYYYDSRTVNIVSSLVDEYRELGVQVKSGEINNLINEEIESGFEMRTNDGSILLHPICIKGQLVKTYNTPLYTKVGQHVVNICFFSTDGEIVVFADENNPKVRVEGTLEKDCREDATYILDVDFNEGQISNALYYRLQDAMTGELVSDGFIENVFRSE